MIHSKLTCCIFLLIFLSGSILFAQEEKPRLEFEVAFNENKQAIDVIWPSCLENAVVSLLDNSLNTIKVQSLCKNNNRIDVSSLSTDLYYIKIAHYTGESLLAMPIKLAKNNSLERQKELDFVMSPNPAQNTITISSELVLSGAKLQLMDMTGN